MQIDFEDADFLIRAGLVAQERWHMGPDVRIVRAKRSHLAVPIYEGDLGWFAQTGTVPDVLCVPRYGQEDIALEKFVDVEGRVLRMGYGPRSNMLAVAID